ncbi:hypothetical protein [Sphingomonas sp. BE137]|uniref:hypothetical protein n=1 Tax=Sphingomonas sp. BE137 TaxID=2817844 RepID=UPI001AE1E34D|nr:hypothetical protein [Sphingomonas sp. BE137]MDR6847147.1 hypothetical protein [Sphingomonas sp. BE137]
MTHDGSLPHLGCRCGVCRQARARIWHALSVPQRAALQALSFAVPRHPADLRQRDRIRWSTIATLLIGRPKRPALIREHQLGERNWHASTMTFFTLNQHGDELIAAMRHHERKAA